MRFSGRLQTSEETMDGQPPEYLDEDGPEIAEVASSRTPAGVTDSSHTSVNRSYATTTTNPYVYKDINEVYGSIKSLTGTSTPPSHQKRR